MHLSFDSDVRPLFRVRDVSQMRTFGGFDLSLYDDVVKNYSAILGRLEKGYMPCDGAWPESQIKTFREWGEQGCPP